MVLDKLFKAFLLFTVIKCINCLAMQLLVTGWGGCRWFWNLKRATTMKARLAIPYSRNNQTSLLQTQ